MTGDSSKECGAIPERNERQFQKGMKSYSSKE
jgi:hypothetical protein